jgi:hypothetical protein
MRHGNELKARATIAPTRPASRAAPNGCANGLLPSAASHRRSRAPAPALSAIRPSVSHWPAPKMTPSAAAPAAVRRTKRASETGGRCRMAASCDCASPNPIAFLQIRSIRSLAAATFCMSTPTGVAAIQCKRGPAGSSIRSTTSPHRADTVTLTPSALPNRSKPRIIRRVVSPLANSTLVARDRNETTSHAPFSGEFVFSGAGACTIFIGSAPSQCYRPVAT